MNETNLSAAAPEQSAPAAAPHEAAGETVTVGALRGAIERRSEQRARRAAEEAAARWSREADELTAQCPDFDLGAALNDTQFCALLRAGVDVRTAWFALHAQALLEAACVRAGRSAEQRVAEHIRARGLRPAENGLGGGGAGIVVRPDVSRMSRADRAALAARGAREAEPVTRFAYIRRDGRCVLRADGHADFCPGRDIVCAGASALVCALAGALDALGAQGVQQTLCAGHAAIAADDRADVRAAFTVAVTGLRQLAAAYPGHVAEDTGRVPAQETEPTAAQRPGAAPALSPEADSREKRRHEYGKHPHEPAPV